MRLQAGCVERQDWQGVRRLAWAMDDYLFVGGYATEWQQIAGAALAAARALGGRRDEGAFLNKLGLAAWGLGQVAQAIEYHEQALRIRREMCAASTPGSPEWTGDQRGEGAALGNLGNAYADLGEPRRAIEYYEDALVIARAIGDRRNEGAWLANLGLAYQTLGEVEQARGCWTQALAIFEAIESPNAGRVRGWLADLENKA